MGLPILSVGIDLGVEISFPIGESFSSGLINSTGFFFGIVYTIVCSQILEGHIGDTTGTRICLMIMVAVGFIGSVLSCMIKEDLKRVNHEKEIQNKENQKDDDKK